MTKSPNNTQQLLYIKSVLTGIKEGIPQQPETTKINVSSHNTNSALQINTIEIYPNAYTSLPFRLITNDGISSLWSDWEDHSDVDKTFHTFDLL
ncbi:hypothetical protein [Priestia megaterium]|uniref:hypothetical protein n=1 Tax=Priestia megaterium TaxID=1404 RepID=UPI000BFDB66B|nr:hypothetical protein [Priestia megaterium]PGQ88312.1 hypothetical protein COA18_05120 [Priestia megaterium]